MSKKSIDNLNAPIRNIERKPSLNPAIFVGIMTTAFASFVLWGIFSQIGFPNTGIEEMDKMLKLSPFVLGLGIGSMIGNVSYKVFHKRCRDES